MSSRTSVHRGIVGMSILVMAAAAIVAGPLIGASADSPPAPVTEFNAQQCPGTTWFDPTAVADDEDGIDTGDVPDLTLVFGQRLADYNAGVPVVLYDAYGANDTYTDHEESAAYPPLCTVRYVEGEGAVSEWMFCTNYHWKVCGGTNAAGQLTGFKGEIIPGLEAVPRNPELTPDGLKIVSYLIRNTHDYDAAGIDGFDFGTLVARADAGSSERVALQVLIWCISDPVDPLTTVESEQRRAQLCAANMDTDEQNRILALMPDPVSSLSFDGTPGQVAAGTEAEFVYTSNLFGDQLTIELTEGSGSVSVLSGPATLAGNQLTVTGSDPAVPAVVRIGVTAAATSDIELTIEGVPSRQPKLAWYQSPGDPAATVPCQVFAQFDEASALRVSAVATSATPRAELARTGDQAWVPALLGGLAMLALGVAGAVWTMRRAREA